MTFVNPTNSDFHKFTDSNIAANGNFPAASPWYQHPGGRVVYSAQGSFGSGTTTLQMSLDGGSTWTGVTNGTDTTDLTASGSIGAELGPCFLRVNMAGSTTPSVEINIAHTGGDRTSG